jgi:hypothetical protein
MTLIGLKNRSYFIMKNVRFLCIGSVSKKILISYCEKFSKTIPFINLYADRSIFLQI